MNYDIILIEDEFKKMLDYYYNKLIKENKNE